MSVSAGTNIIKRALCHNLMLLNLREILLSDLRNSESLGTSQHFLADEST